MRKEINKWKIAFFVLLASIGFIFIALIVLVNLLFPKAEDEHYTAKQPASDEATFLIQTDREKMNAFIASFLADNPNETSYTVELLEETVEFRSSFYLVGQQVRVTIKFDPVVSKSGDLLLEVRTFSVGFLQLPVDRVLQLIRAWIDTPEWVKVYPNEQIVEVLVTDIRIDAKEAIKFRFVTFDLANNQINMEILF